MTTKTDITQERAAVEADRQRRGEPVKCQSADMGKYACTDRQQCWEPCGELGKSAEHARVAEPVKVPSYCTHPKRLIASGCGGPCRYGNGQPAASAVPDKMRMALEMIAGFAGTRSLKTIRDIRGFAKYAVSCAAPVAQEPVAWPKNAQEIRDFIDTNFISREGGDIASDDDKYFLTAHDLLSAFAWWVDIAPVAAQAARDVLAERRRQITAEGWTPEHDDMHPYGVIARAAACYATGNPRDWPWREDWWKPKTQRRNLVRAGALILAEIERLDRGAARAAKEQS